MSNLQELVKLKPLVAIDTETWGDITKQSVYHPDICMSHVAYATEEGKTECFDAASHEEEWRKALHKYVETGEYIPVFWNAAFDIPVLQKEGIIIKYPVVDAMILAQTVCPEEQSFSLKHFSSKFLNDRYDEEVQLKAFMRKHRIKQYGDVPYKVIAPYNIKDAINTIQLGLVMVDMLDTMQLWETFSLEMRLLPYVLNMTKQGVRINKKMAEKLAVVCHSKIATLKTAICTDVGNPAFNPNSPKQIADVLYKDKAPTRFSKGGSPSTDNLTLLQIGTKLSKRIQQARKLSKALSTYYKPLIERPVRDIMHCNFNQNRAITGRFSSSSPNLQNLPRSAKGALGVIRRAYRARSQDHRLVCIDFSQIEMRLCAHFSGEKYLLNTIRRGEDIHDNTCVLLFNKKEGDHEFKTFRYLAKRLNFATLYGTGAAKFANTVLEDTEGSVRVSVEDAARYIVKWWSVHKKVDTLRNQLMSEVALTGGVRTHYNRYIPVVSTKDHAALNYLIQGTAADVLKRAIIKCGRLLRQKKARTKMILTVHDEIIFDMPLSEFKLIPELVKAMEVRHVFDVPLTVEVEVGKSWGSKKPITLAQIA